ncbi:putative two-component system response regulator [Natranaerovirga hydrolytica]|uniref:Stage 0 sporulation protein A homolog n=1 Tax=Natranaerovirga hydrolytica TaxID=680378 RepID=A0A4R1M9F4_9FIRM|nr:HD domain-containing phosphohydrolase [Natranaerovirga hydrolytica]TCK88010.1 putative two-component system response regulator [Natranaerovirga hydrolytica]
MKVLIVDDDLISLRKLEWLVKSLGHETITAQNGEEAWQIWKDQGPRMLITDWIMPKVSGPSLCEKIRNSEGRQYTYIIIVTTKRNTHDLIEAINAGADNFISKPYSKEELSAKITSGQRIVDLESRDMIIFAISKLAESRDVETGNHLERIRYYSKILAQHLHKKQKYDGQVDHSFIDNIFLTSPLHDIGKIGIPDHILLKPDRLDDEEFAIMKTHTIIGHETLIATANKDLKADYLKMSASIALSHHEKYDGSGYPHGLKGEEIPLPARIVALADVYDALVSKRVYKTSYPHDISKSIILKGNKTHFDPTIVEAFLACEDQFIEVSNLYKDH